MAQPSETDLEKIATRQAFGEALVEIADKNSNIVVISCDLSGATGTRTFKERYNEDFYEIGIAEQNAVSIAAGFALEEFRPFVTSFGAFLTKRAHDQIAISAAYSNAPVVLVGTHSGLAIGKDGGTQMGTSDINAMIGIPGMKIFQPADARETKQIVNYLAESRELAYLRLSRRPQPSATHPNYTFESGKIKELKSGNDVSIFATGDSVYHSLEAANTLKENYGIDASVLNISTIKPFDKETASRYLEKSKAAITVEDHSVIGGLGTCVAEVISEEGLGKKLLKIGVPDVFGESGAPEDLYRKYGMDKEGIINSVKDFYKSL